MKEINSELRALADPEKAKILQSFFKTGPGQYGQGDVLASRFPSLDRWQEYTPAPAWTK